MQTLIRNCHNHALTHSLTIVAFLHRNTTNRFSAKKPSETSAGTPAGNSIFSSVSLQAPAATPSGGSGSGNPFGGFTFGTPALSASSAAKPAFPAFAMPAASTKAVVPKPSTNGNNTGGMTENDEKLIQCAKGFLKHMKNLNKADVVCYQRFITTFSALSDAVEATITAAGKTKSGTATNNWDSSRPLFGGGKPLISPSAGSANASATTTTASLFGASTASPAVATGGFSFNPTKTGAGAAPVPAFSFSTAQSPAVKAAAETAAAKAASATKPESTGDDTNKEEDGDGVLEAANDDYEVLYKTKTKILRVSKNLYIKGILKLEKHKESGKNRMVVRDSAVGRVKMNTAISKGMPLSKSIVPATKKKGPTPIVIIKAVFDEDSKDPEDFKIIVSNDEQENLYNELKKLV